MNPRYRPLAATTLIFVIAYAICIFQFPAMWSTRVFGNFLTDNAFLGIAAVGATFVIISGGIDLSVGAVIGLTGTATDITARVETERERERLQARAGDGGTVEMFNGDRAQ